MWLSRCFLPKSLAGLINTAKFHRRYAVLDAENAYEREKRGSTGGGLEGYQQSSSLKGHSPRPSLGSTFWFFQQFQIQCGIALANYTGLKAHI